MESMNIPMRDILQRILKRRKIRPRPGLNYNLEKQEEPGVSIDLDATLASMDTMEFSLVRENSTRRHHNEGSEDEVSTMADSLTSHQYKSYIVSMVHRLRANTDVQLGVSGEKVEVDPVGSKGTKFFKQRAMTYDADNIASCEVLEEKSTGKSVFRITYLISHDYKHSDFEADSEVCNEIVSKINNILELRLSPARKDYVATRAAKHLRKRDSLRDSFRLSKYTDN
ncbi:MAPKAP1 [Mytilus coruscus]|uniref:Target of rapamycin complex 2 subunit MAPKAP1 n=1 Tax=Mytilus coruscus TaxID=42192 RepID=A0A6J8BT71_MYTCO|nr:MAPKAP1 [Mytilus coruscus]